MYGVDAKANGAQEYYNSIFKMYAEWGIDYVKVDDIARVNYAPEAPGAVLSEIELIKNAIANCGRDIVLSLSPGPAKVEEKDFLLANANMWRMTDDFWDKWEHLYGMFERCHAWQGVGCKDHWPDCDMLPLGHVCVCNQEGSEKGHYTHFSHDEQKILMTLWCIFRSPLMFGGELRDNDEFTDSLLTNERIMNMHKNGRKARQILRKDDFVIWRSVTKDGKLYLALFNISEEEKKVKLKLKDIGLSPRKRYQAVEMWTNVAKELSNGEKFKLKPHTVLCFEIDNYLQ